MPNNIKQAIYRPYAICKIWKKFRKYRSTNSDFPRLFLLNIPTHGNLGDHLLSVAEHKFFKDNFADFEIVPVTSSDLYYSLKVALSNVRSNDILCVTGGGFLGSLYEEEERFLRILKLFPNNKIIVLPQTIYYEDTQKGRELLKKAKSYYQNHNNLYAIARDVNSFNLLNDVLMRGCEDRIAFTPDLALYLNSSRHNNRDGILWCLRNDGEINKLNENIIRDLESQVESLKLQVECTDTYVPYYVPYNAELREVTNKLRQFSKAKLVITDRLHGMIYSVITGTPVIAMDNINGKVGQVYKQWLNDIEYVKFLSSQKQAEDIVEKMLNIENCVYDNSELIKKYQPIIDFINA